MVAGGRELIDTLWNVNYNGELHKKSYALELIDTLWNVNCLLIKRNHFQIRINRYIMECKFVSTAFLTSGRKELIDTLWNVNFAVVRT